MGEAEFDETVLWRRLRANDDRAARDALYGHYAPWAAAIGAGLFRQYRKPGFESDDYLQNARIGLLEAMSRYDPEHGVPFRAFAQSRVRGSVLNGLRAVDNRLLQTTGHIETWSDSGVESASAEGDAFDAVVDAVADASIAFLLGSACRPSADSRDGYHYASTRQIETRIRAAVDALPERLREILLDHYYRDLPFHALAARDGLSKGRVSQLHHEALRRVRAALREM